MQISKPNSYRVLNVPSIDFSEIESVLYRDFGKNSIREDNLQAHIDTQSVIIKFTKNFDVMEGYALGAYDELFPYIEHILSSIAKEYGYEDMRVLRMLFVRLGSGGYIPPHADGGVSFHCTHRIHYALKTNEDVSFVVNGEELPFMEHPCIEINNVKEHSVVNNSKEDRIHMIMDLYNG